MGAELRMLARLNAETEVHHGDADSDLDRYVFHPDATRADYRTYLARVYGFIAPLEQALVRTPGLDQVVDLPARAKSALLLYDLLALGMTLEEVQELPQCLSIPAFRGPAAALGWMYVAERPTLQACVVRSHVESTLGRGIASSTAYLSCYAGHAGQRWRELAHAMEEVATTSALADRMALAASEAFRCLLRWKTQESARDASIRIAG
jgi:heme oxygenase